jgi:predicted dehydrogenase
MQLVKVGLCAFGMSGKVFHAPFLKEHPGFFISAVVERSKEESKEKYPEAKIYRSVEEMLQNADIELVVVNTPVQTHFEYAKMALEAGKNVLLKNLYRKCCRSRRTGKTGGRKGLFVSVYQNRRFDRDYLQVQKIFNEGKLGNIKEAEIRFDRFRTTPSGKQHKENPDQVGSGSLHDLERILWIRQYSISGIPKNCLPMYFL